MRILIADDLPLQVRELSDGIRSVWPDWEILTADNGQSVVEAVSAAPVDVVLSDIRMPRMDGLEMLSVVREISPKTKIVFITAYPLFEYAQQALKLQREQCGLERRAVSREQREAEAQRQFELRRQKHREKHRGR